MRENPFAINFEQSETFDNPKKTLRGWFEREGYDLVYDCREKAPGQFICRIKYAVLSEIDSLLIITVNLNLFDFCTFY